MVIEELPRGVSNLIGSALRCQFATVSSAGLPIDTPMLSFVSDGLVSIDVGTGLTYPVKAERARKNPKTGLLIEGRPDEPVISIACRASVTDSDLQANTDRYIAEAAFIRVDNAPWNLARQLITYWTRIIVRNYPVRILWWDNRAALDDEPHCWLAPETMSYPASDPAPPGSGSAPLKWPQRDWRYLAERALARGTPGHITLLDDEGFPLPFPVRKIDLEGDGFALSIPNGAPWRTSGKASLTFDGRETFVGSVDRDGETTRLRVDRALPIHPYVEEPSSKWEASQEIQDAFNARLVYETQRRGQPIPTIPETEPEPTEGATMRRERLERLSAIAAAEAL